MAKTIVIANQKGGATKTSAAINTADGLNKGGYKTLVLDVDPQANTTSTFQAVIKGEYTLYDIIEKNCIPEQAVQHTNMGDIIAGDPQLAGNEASYLNTPRAYKLYNQIIKDLGGKYDFIIIDTPPNLGLYLKNALMIADWVIIPVIASGFAISGISDLMQTIHDAADVDLNPELKVAGVLISNYNATNKKANVKLLEELEQIKEEFHISVFRTKIRTNASVNNSQNECKSLFEFDPRSNAATDYFDYIQELLKIIESGD